MLIHLPDAQTSCRNSSGDNAASVAGSDPLCSASAPTVSFMADVLPAVSACTGEICHAPWRYDSLVGQHSLACCDHRLLVAPGSPSTSHLVQALRGSNACVSQMPLDEGSLSSAEIATVVAWICQGAPDN